MDINYINTLFKDKLKDIFTIVEMEMKITEETHVIQKLLFNGIEEADKQKEEAKARIQRVENATCELKDMQSIEDWVELISKAFTDTILPVGKTCLEIHESIESKLRARMSASKGAGMEAGTVACNKKPAANITKAASSTKPDIEKPHCNLTIKSIEDVVTKVTASVVEEKLKDRVLVAGDDLQNYNGNMRLVIKDTSTLPFYKRLWISFRSRQMKVMYVAIGLLLFTTICQRLTLDSKEHAIEDYCREISKANDKVTQFDYIQSVGYATPRLLNKLDTIFVINRDESRITNIKNYVHRYQNKQREAVSQRIREEMKKKEFYESNHAE